MLIFIGICAHVGALYYASEYGMSVFEHGDYRDGGKERMRARIKRQGLFEFAAAIVLTALGIACIWGGA
jgi:hypothetical protein